MTRDRQLFLIAGLVLLASLAAFFFLLESKPATLDPAGDSASVGDELGAVVDFGQARRSSSELGDDQVEAGGARLDHSDHLPRYGDELFTGDARVEFEIRDARDQILPDLANLSAKLYRIESGVHVEEVALVDRIEGLVRCVGATGSGLEPGHYAMKLQAGPYGALWKDFDVARGQRYRETIRFETWTRVICLRFVDAEGRAMPRLPSAPNYQVKNAQVPERQIIRGPGLVLRDPPGEEEFGSLGMGGGAGGSSGGRRPARAQATLDGCWFLQVVAGGEGKLRISLNESRDGVGTIEMKSRFLEAEWDDFVIRLAPTEEQLARLARYPLENPNDPGNQSELVVPRPIENSGNPREFESSMRSWARVIVHGPSEAQADLKLQVDRPKYSTSLRHMGWSYIDRRARKMDGIWFSDVKLGFPDSRLGWSWHDGALLRTEGRSIPQTDYVGANRVVEQIDPFEVMPFRLVLGPISPTVDAWVRAFQVAWGGDRDSSEGNADRRSCRIEDGAALDTAVVRDESGQPRFGSSLVLDLIGDARWSKREFRLPWSATMSADAGSGELIIEPPPQGLALRCLDEEGRALPWVEGSIMEFDRLDLSLRVRDALAASEVKVDFQTPFLTRNIARRELELLDESSDLAEIHENVGDQVWEALADQEARLMVARNGAWYDSRRKVRGDDRGYVIDFNQSLVAGRRHVLWLWSRSRDAFKPDRMIVFTATEGLTDLGLIQLPRWQRD